MSAALPQKRPFLSPLPGRAAVAVLAAGAAVFLPGAESARAGEIKFQYHSLDRTLPSTKDGLGDYGLTALVDLNKDGRPDFVLGGRQPKPERLYWYENKGKDDWQRHEAGQGYQSDVGLTVLDVDGDSWPDLVCSGVWFRNPGQPEKATGPWEKFTFAANAGGAHDILSADMDGDGRRDIVMMSDGTKPLQTLCWFRIAENPRDGWARHDIGPGIHGAITPAGVGDINGDGFPDVIRADTWFESKGGRGVEWIPHPNIPAGRSGPYGFCVRTAIADMDGNGGRQVVMADADIGGSKIFILRTADKGQTWTRQDLPQSFRCGSLHSLAVADFNGDGRLDIVSNEQEELLPADRKNPRWVLWENLGGGQYAEHIILDQKLGGHELQAADVDGDGDIDIVSKNWGAQPWNGADGKMHVDWLENLRKP